MKTFGIDVSSHNGRIDWEKVKPHISFAIIRAGFGVGNIDLQGDRNISECNRLSIPVGAYWFSYAGSVSEAVSEGVSCVNFLKKYQIDLPVAYDFEYDSIARAQKRGINITAKLLMDMADEFLNVVSKNGYKPMLYSNPDFLRQGFQNLVGKYPLWLAHYTTEKRKYCDCLVWQYDEKGKINGAGSNIDYNIGYDLIPETKPKVPLNYGEREQVIKRLPDKWWDMYVKVARDIINGKYGNGEDRKKKLSASGYDPTVAQAIVNFLLNKG